MYAGQSRTTVHVGWLATRANISGEIKLPGLAQELPGIDASAGTGCFWMHVKSNN